MNKIVIQNNVSARIIADDATVRKAADALTVRHEKASVIKWKLGWSRPDIAAWDGTIKFLRRPANTFPVGLVGRVLSAVGECGIEDKRVAPTPTEVKMPASLQGIEALREHQVEYAERALPRSLLRAPTSAGKTEIACELIRRLRVRTLFLTHRRILLSQSADRIMERLGFDSAAVGTVGGGVWEPGSLVAVSTVQTLARHLRSDRGKELVQWAEMVIVDEVHHGAAKQYVTVLNAAANAYYRVGLSAKPSDSATVDSWALEGLFGPEVDLVTLGELQARGLVSTAEIRLIQYDGMPLPPRMPWADAQREGIVRCAARNLAIAGVAEDEASEGRKVLVLVTQIEHGETLSGMISGSRFIRGATAEADREEALADLRAGRTPVLIATTILDEGVDVPEFDTLILAGGGRSELSVLQRMGRVLRAREGKVARVYDFMDTTHRYLASHSLERVRVYREQGMRVVRQKLLQEVA